MKISWTSLKISIAGARLSHLVQKDKIWDHGSMAEQARIIFYLVLKAKASGNLESLKRQCTISCFEKIKIEQFPKSSLLISHVIKEIAIIDVQPGKNKKPDMFTAIINGIANDTVDNDTKAFSAKCPFVRQGEWWLLDNIALKIHFQHL